MPPLGVVPQGNGRWRETGDAASGALYARVKERFPGAADLSHTPDRRRFMRLMAASLALSGLAGCDDDERDEIVPPVDQAAGSAPGTVLTYASSTLLDGFANGVLVTTRDGRPTKIEGNPEHPWSRGGTDVFGQASVLGFYDPFRSQSVQQNTRDSDLAAFRAALVEPLARLRASGGEGFAVLLGPTTSPSLAAQLDSWRRAWPRMRVHTHMSASREALYEGTRRAFGRRLETQWRLAEAKVVVCLDGDLLDAGPHQVGVARGWADARQARAAEGGLLQMWAAGPVPSLTRAKADHDLVATPALVGAMADWLLARAAGQAEAALPPAAENWCKAAWAALDGARGASVVQTGLHADAALHEAMQRLNASLGNTGRTVLHTAPLLLQGHDLSSLVAEMKAGRIQTLLMLGTNPVYDAPPGLDFAEALARVKLAIHAGPYADETGQNADWHLPMAHPLGSWDDARALDGTACLIQPTMARLNDGLTAAEIVSLFADREPRAALDLLRAHWVGQESGAEARWQRALLSGILGGATAPTEAVQVQPGPPSIATSAENDRLTLVFRPDPTVWDGTLADNAWLQELPKPLTKIVWENVVGMGPGMAARDGLANGDMVSLTADGRTIDGPVWIFRGQSDDVVSLTLGYGRRVVGQLSAGLGYDAGQLRGVADPWRTPDFSLRRTGEHRKLAGTQDHAAMQGQDFVRVQRVGDPKLGNTSVPPSLTSAREPDGRAWGMVIDLDSCIGCNACITACQAENNIAVVGRDEVLHGREMHWLRVDFYDDKHFMPVPCMNCEQAPCEVGCPVEATLHDHEGLNLMVYNRCIGTRACSGYCPYKVRRFNYGDYSAGAAPSIIEQRNPDVTVRARGVMEKCTYCVQRIAEARAVADRDDTPIADGTVRTACQSACPTRAIAFGDLAQPDSAVARAQADPRRYALLGELGTRPRTTYLAARAPAAGS